MSPGDSDKDSISETNRRRREKGKRGQSCPASDGPARRRWQGDTASEKRNNLLNRSQVRNGGCVDDEGVGLRCRSMEKGLR